MKVLYISNIGDSTGWSHAGIDYILALDAVGVDVTVRRVVYNPTQGEIPSRVLELERKRHDKYDAVIQQVLPPEFEYHSGLGLNIGLFFTESQSYEYSDWAEYCNLLDLLLVPNSQAKEAAVKSGVTKPIEIVPCPIDTAKFQRAYKPLSLRDEIGDSFVFYFISEFNERKNLAALVKAFHLEFDTWEKVELVIKSGAHSSGLQVQTVDDFLTEIKSDLRLYPRIQDYKQERVILGHLTEENMMRLHATGDVFVMPSSAEGWSLPSHVAAGIGNPVIVNGYFKYLPFLTESNTWFVDYHMENASGMHASPPGTNTGREMWAKIEVESLRKCMREAFENRQLSREKGNNGFKIAQQFSHGSVGLAMRTAIERHLS